MPIAMTTVLWNATLIDGTGRDPMPGMAVVVEGERIDRIASVDALTPPRDAEQIDATGLTLMPGLTDAHVHLGIVRTGPGAMFMAPALHALRIAKEIESCLDAGYTTVRDAGGIDGAWPHAVRAGLVRGPRILPSGATLSQTGGHGDQRSAYASQSVMPNLPGLFTFADICDSPDQVRRAARDNFRRGATQIKVMASGGVMSPTDEVGHSQFTVEEMAAAAHEARAVGSYVMAHAYAPPAIMQALEAGVTSIEHGNLLDEATAREMAKRDAWLVPTMVTFDMDSAERMSPENRRKSAMVKGQMADSVRIAMEAGVSIGSGSDLLGTLQVHKTREFGLQAAVMGNMAAIVCATSGNAKLFRLDDRTGSVEEGNLADLILVDGNPIDEISVLESADNVKLVMKEGVVMKRTPL
jgi:imidazolonepropionase-like amidohydrolase